MKHVARVVACSLGLMALAAGAAAAQQEKNNWSNQWYWGAHVGGLGYATATQPTYWDPLIGAHWFITRQRFGLYAGIEQAFFTDDAHTVVAGRVATFSEVRRFMAGLVALPLRVLDRAHAPDRVPNTGADGKPRPVLLIAGILIIRIIGVAPLGNRPPGRLGSPSPCVRLRWPRGLAV